MWVSQVVYKRVHVPGVPETIELSILLEEGDTVAEAIKKARATVAREFGELSKPSIDQALKVLEQVEVAFK